MKRRLLISWVYYQPVGHAIEAYRAALAFRNANPDLEIAVAVNARSGAELGSCVPAIDALYPIDVQGVASPETALAAIGAVPRDWEYLYCDPRQSAPMGSDALDHVARAFRASMRVGLATDGWHTPAGFPARHLTPLVLDLPAAAREFASAFVPPGNPVRISLLLGSGSAGSRTPPLAFWRALIHALIAAFGDVEVVLLGALKPGRSVTQGLDRDAVDGLVREFPQVRDAFDLGLLNQLAIAERCGLHISPHTGMSFAVQCVGTPWLAIAGGEMHEAVLNGVPFVSVYTDCPRYPCGPWFDPVKNQMLPECRERKVGDRPFLCMTEDRLTGRLPEIVGAARALVEGTLTYQECVQAHYRAVLPRIGKQDGDPLFFDWDRVMAEDFVFPSGA